MTDLTRVNLGLPPRHISRRELTGRMTTLADKIARYRGPLTVTVPETTIRSWEHELRRIVGQIHALPDMHLDMTPTKEWHREKAP